MFEDRANAEFHRGGARKQIPFKAVVTDINAILARSVELIKRAEVFRDAAAALARWRRGGMKIAILSPSGTCRPILDSAALLPHADAVIDGGAAGEFGLKGKPDAMLEACCRIGAPVEQAVALEDSAAGVREALRNGFGFVVGVSRDGGAAGLHEAGAHQTVENIYRVRFPRRIPSLLERLDELSRWRNARPLALFVDFDGTLAPIVDDPKAAAMPDLTRSVLRKLADRWPVAVVSGRDREDVERRVNVEGVIYVGDHGFDIRGKGFEKTLPEAVKSKNDLAFAERELRRRLDGLPGVILEPKPFSIAVHYRQVRDASLVGDVVASVDAVLSAVRLRKKMGKKVVELTPPVDWDKGRAVQWLIDGMPEGGRCFPIYIGDDETDEDAFAVLEDHGPGIRVGAAVAPTLADYRLANSEEVRELLKWLDA